MAISDDEVIKKNLIGSNDININTSGDDIYLSINNSVKEEIKEDLIDSLVGTFFTLTTDVEVGSAGSVSGVSLAYPTDCDKNNLYMISFKIKDKNGSSDYYITQYVTTYTSNGEIKYDQTLKVTYEDNGLYLYGKMPFSSTTVTIELIFIKLES